MAIVRFGPFDVDTDARELRKSGRRVRLPDQPLRLLNLLLADPGRLVSRDELQQRLWGDGISVDFEIAINKAVSQLRVALGDSASKPQFIETLAKRGYRFIADVERIDDARHDAQPIAAVAVLPFANLTGDSQQQFLADGISDALITALGTFTRLRVVSRTSARAALSGRHSLAEIARMLRVDAVVEGSVFRSGEVLRIVVRLVRAAGEQVIWQDRYEQPLEWLAPFLDDVARTIAGAIGVRADPRRGHSVRTAAVHPEAQLACLRGRYLCNRRTVHDIRASIREFERATRLQPDLAPAYAGLAEAYVVIGIWGLEEPARTYADARAAAEQALGLDDDLAEAHSCMAEVHKGFDRDWERSEAGFLRAIALNPSYSPAYHFYAQLQAILGRHEQALALIERARQLDPLSQGISAQVSYILIAARQFAAALAEARTLVELEPYSALARRRLGRALLFAGHPAAAIAEHRRAIDLGGTGAMWEADLCFALARAGERDEARGILTRLEERAVRREYISPVDLAVCTTALGDHARALDYLEHACTERVMRVVTLTHPEFDGLAGDPRYRDLLTRLRLPQVAR